VGVAAQRGIWFPFLDTRVRGRDGSCLDDNDDDDDVSNDEMEPTDRRAGIKNQARKRASLVVLASSLAAAVKSDVWPTP